MEKGKKKFGFINKVQLIILDFLAPIEAWFYSTLFLGSWTSKISNRIIKKSNYSDKTLHRKWDIFLPDNWLKLFLFTILLIFSPQIILLLVPEKLCLFFFNSTYFRFSSNELISTTWQVLAALISISLVIIVLLIEFLQRRDFEARLLPTFIAETQLMFVFMIGMVSTLSLGVGLFLLSHQTFSIEIPEKISRITGFNLVLFIENIFFVVLQYGKLFRFITPLAETSYSFL